MRLFSRHAAFLLAFCFGKPSRVLAQPAQQITLDDVWNVAPGTTNGGCDNNRPILEQWNDESGELVLNAIRSLGDYSTNDVVRAAVQSFFKLQPKKGTTQPAKNNQFVALQRWVADTFSEMLEFFDGTWIPVGTVNRKPALYCDSSWQIQEANGVHATARDVNGQPVWINGQPQSISSLYGTAIKAGQLPYWSNVMQCYVFEAPDNAGQYCANNPQSKGATANARYTTGVDAYDNTNSPTLSIVTLCPLAFSDPEDIADLPQNAQGMRDNQGRAIENGTPLSKVLPRSSTLLHEAFHVRYGGRMKSTDEKYSVAECLAWKQADALENPENYVLFAVAMWYREKGNWNFSKGTAKQ